MANTTVCLSYDFDALSLWLHGFDGAVTPTQRSRGCYGAEVAAPRLLDLHDRLDVPATWFVPGHTIESFPEIAGEVWDRGYDIQHHGWSHTNPTAYEDRDAERDDIVRGIECIEALTGRAPTGYRSPAWDFSAHTLDILEELGFEWDSSQMGHDFRPYYLRRNWRAPPDGPYEHGEETDIVEFPVSWKRDDFPAFAYVPNAASHWGFADERSVFELWEAQLDWLDEHVDGGVYLLTMHPQVIGQAPRVEYLAELIRDADAKSALSFATIDEVAGAVDRGEIATAGDSTER